MSLSPGSRVGPYEIVGPLGAGGMGVVYRARDARLNRDVAIKVLPDAFAKDDERLARFTREAQTLAALNHPNIAAIYGIEEAEGMRALVMELVEGDDLSHRIALSAIPIDEALPIAKQIAEALEAAHELGIVHRDLKPANIKVRADGTVKVLDFGLAKAMESGSGIGDPGSAQLANSPTITSPALTARGVILGTASYMSPEQAAGKAVDKRSDIFSFGVVMLEILTGQPVFTGETVSHVLASVLKSEPDWSALPANTPPLIRRLLRRCLEKDRKRRLDSAAAVRLEIEEALSGPTGPPPTSVRSSMLPWAVVGGLGIAMVAAILIWSPWRSTPALATRFNLSVSRETSLSLRSGVAISPDGRMVAFVAQSDQGSSLYVRRLDEWEPHALLLTEGASGPFFSPDGRWIAFAKGNLLKKIPVTGGPPQDICKATDQDMLGGSWQRDGSIVFGAWPQTGLWRVSSDGGTPRPIVQTIEGSGVQYEEPEPLPGGKGILFTLNQEGRTSVMALGAGANTPRTIVESGSNPRYLPTGHLVYVVDGHLTVVPFDLDRLAVGGGATTVVDDVNDLSRSNYDVSANGVLVYLPAGSSRNIVLRDRKGETKRLGAGSRHFQQLALSPDGNKLSVNIREGRSRNIWTGDVASGLLTRLTFGNDDAFGVWSRDGRRLFYTGGTREGFNIFSIPTDGSGKAVRITESSHPQNPTSVSPDGDTILFNDIDPSTKDGGDIWEFSLSRREPKPFVKTRFVEYGAVFSSDGRWVAYQSDESGQMEVYVQGYPGPGAKRRVSLQGGQNPVWSHSGRELFYQTATAVFSVPVLDAHDLRMGTPQRLFGYAVDGQPRMAVSADDQRFLMLEPAATNQSSQINIVQNWFEELKARVPIK